ncbi:Ribonucleases P/MRP protein subunit pop1 [Dispira parvispora]|uniref:Ribonucleases P/MRP protein subunit pop1 n=1 Tax=Dispira parvispora TaxID=1520584 RepID=A0A9W8AQG7_9FUNG|nr:Ribonucleases P/MRP protein subunit pop1 [Dispira parvispora]
MTDHASSGSNATKATPRPGKGTNGQGKTVPGKQKRWERVKKYRQIETPLAKQEMEIPTFLSVDRFLEARAAEIMTMEKAINQARLANNVRAMQTLPRNLRRRTASHNVKRLPYRLRAKALQEVAKSGGVKAVKKKKPNSRRTRRYPGNIAEEFQRRQRDKRWLETHMWHAKRMKMVQRWGCMVAEHHNERSIKASYRATKHMVLATDMSYNAVIELCGGWSMLAGILAMLLDPTTLVPFSHERYVSGAHQFTGQLFHPLQFPFAHIAPVTLLWQPLELSSSSPSTSMEVDPASEAPCNRRVWLILHPAAKQEVTEAITKAIGLLSTPSADVVVHDLTGKLNMFHLAGPHTISLLEKLLNVLQPEATENPLGFRKAQLWKQISSLRSTCSLPPGSVLGLDVHDPRLTFPSKVSVEHVRVLQQAGLPTPEASEWLTRWPLELASSALWDQDINSTLLASKVSEHSLNSRRANQLVPGSKLEPTPLDAVVPILLLQRASLGCSNGRVFPEFTQGWTLIVPQGWGADFWKCLIFAGVRVGGIRDFRNNHFEAGLPCFPFDMAGNAGFTHEQATIKADLESQYEKRPPGKRINYEKLGITHPFEAPLHTLVPKEQKDSDEVVNQSLTLATVDSSRYCIAQGQALRELLETFLLQPKQQTTPANQASTLDCLRKALVHRLTNYYQQRVQPLLLPVRDSSVQPHNSSPTRSLNKLDIHQVLVRVQVHHLSRGTPEPYCILYPATSEMFDEIKQQRQVTRAYARWEQSLQKGNFSSATSDYLVNQPSEALNLPLLAARDYSKQQAQDYSLQSTPPVAKVDEPLGYTVNGQFSLHHGYGLAQGYCSVARLLTMVTLNQQFVSGKLFAMLRKPSGHKLYPVLLELLD